MSFKRLFKTLHGSETLPRVYLVSVLFAALSVMIYSGKMAAVGGESPNLLGNSMYEVFHVGGSCAALAYIDEQQLRYVTSSDFKDEFASFCYPEEPFECSDYNALVGKVGRFEPSPEGYYCKLAVN